MEEPRATLRDVAGRAGVSTTAASLALRGRPGVSEATRQRILVAASELGYRAPARRDTTAERRVVGVLLRDIVSTYSHDVVAGLEEMARDTGLEIVLEHGSGEERALDGKLASLRRIATDGIVVISTAIGPDTLRAAAREIPIVVVGSLADPVAGVDVVCNDDEHGARLAVRHLLDLGHTRIAHLTRGTEPGSAAGRRRDGFADEMARAVPGIPPQVEGGSHERRGPATRYLVHAMRHEKNPPTAVFTETDRLAIDLIGACGDAGLRVPDDVSIVGYDSTSICEMIRPRLTSVSQPRQDMGRSAFRLLQERHEGRTQDRRVVLRPTLHVRGSTAAV
ncbi:LacI family DNA-binding transcriptional regulator [Microbacterium karelineae]|uniref:LacI family DNA-binding transcriptional regulator n=1 Tax=Microbacterium karelineae TaxID=2654283 RepID=UPI0018D438BE|nr:LacI family DNA-binding transcriptional regulator [Microbacterium karelineae]